MALTAAAQRYPIGSTPAAQRTPAPFDVVRALIDDLVSQAKNPWAKFNLEAAAETLRVLPVSAVAECHSCSDAATPAERFRVAREALHRGAAAGSDPDNIQVALCMACLATAERYWS